MRFSNNPFISFYLRKAIMNRSKLKNIYNKYRTDDYWANYKKQINFYVNLFSKTKTEYFQKLNVNDLSDNRKLWKTKKTIFSYKGLNSNKNAKRRQPTYYRGKGVSHRNDYLFCKHNREFRSKEG